MTPHKHVLVLVAGFALASGAALAGQDQVSVAEAARRAQAAKKTSGKPAMVLTNDNLSTLKGSVSIVGQVPAPAPPEASAKIADDPTAKSQAAAPADKQPSGVKDETYWREIFATAHKKLAGDEHELDILQREFNLKLQQAYTDPNTAMREQYSREDLNNTKKNIDLKTDAVAQDKQAISDLEDDLRKAGGEPAWATAP